MSIRIVALGAFVFAAAAALPSFLARVGMAELFEAHPTGPHFVVKTALLAFSLVAILLSRHSWPHFGFAGPKAVHWLSAIAKGALFGALATALILLTPAQGMPNLRDFGLLGIVVSIWFYSSVVEELFVRGWLQSSLDLTADNRLWSVVVSALFFGGMHLTLIPAGADWMTVVIIVITTTLLGSHTARLRQAHGSLMPPIVAHVAFNVGGFVAGVGLNIIAIARTGSPLVS